MKLNKMKKEDLEVLSYTDLTEMILKENKKAMNTKDIFTEVCKLLGLTEEDFSNKIGDFYTSLTTDKRFVSLSNGKWDLKDKHKTVIVMDDDDEDYTDDSEEEVEEEQEDESIEITDDEVDLDDDDELEDLTIVADDDLERDDI